MFVIRVQSVAENCLQSFPISDMSMKRHTAIHLVSLGAGAIVALAIAGCGKKAPPIAPVTGKVTYEGKPLPGRAVIHFMSDAGFGSSCEVQPDGTFLLGSEYGKGIPLGKYKVSIMPPIPSPLDTKADVHPNYYFIPRKYRDFGTNDFSAEITADGANKFTFDMKP